MDKLHLHENGYIAHVELNISLFNVQVFMYQKLGEHLQKQLLIR